LKTAAISFVASAVTAAVLTPVVRDLAVRRGWLDQVGARKVHARPIPRVGGIAIVVAFYVPLVALFFANSAVGQRFWAYPDRALALFAGGLAVAALGVWDDLRGANARLKLTVQFAVAAMAYGLGFRIDVLESPFGGVLELGVLGLPFTMLWIAGVINALNLIDGLDGLAGGVALIAVGSIFLGAALQDAPLMLLFTAALAGALVGFLPYNVNPASVFMGDTGSMFLGFVLATTAIRVNQSAGSSVAILAPIVALGVPIADTLLAMTRRAFRGAPLFSADRFHVHHRLLALGLSHRQTVLVLWGASVVLALASVAIRWLPDGAALAVTVALMGGAGLALHKLGYVRPVDPKQVIEQRRRNLDRREGVARASRRLRDARGPADLWAAARDAAAVLEAQAVSLRVTHEPGVTTEYTDDAEHRPEVLLEARFPIPGSETGEALRLGWADGRESVDRDTEIAAEYFCEELAVAAERLRASAARRPARLRIA
jgi:UDP-GlcNAc:undecaprenyl-phosphate GlcNAc-1-phosphate transferase